MSTDKLSCLQPKQTTEIKDFLLTARRKDATSVKIKKPGKGGGVTKFKVRCSRYLYTLCVQDSDKADKLRQSLPPGKTILEYTECLTRQVPQCPIPDCKFKAMHCSPALKRKQGAQQPLHHRIYRPEDDSDRVATVLVWCRSAGHRHLAAPAHGAGHQTWHISRSSSHRSSGFQPDKECARP